ncbi:16S rRNA (uracil(1498)-N(3))-methyltransferase [Amphibacillus sp. Q70]|uniref:16S rRNA (uracil(1498)-N(3))-methyltransferase n=1 Tax=Amphibacillus sp. Q70 TaxID=3453416 RepID=UPI003F87E7FD
MQRYFVEPNNWFEQHVKIDSDDYHHIVHVMRMKLGDEVICNHPSGEAYRCLIEEISNGNVQLLILDKLKNQVELPVNVTLIQGLPKGDKLEWVVQKTTELGVKRIIPLACDRSIVKWDDKKSVKKIQRLQKIAKEASEQAHRTVQPVIETPYSLKQLISADQSFDHKFVAYEETTRKAETQKISYYLEHIEPDQSIAIVIGPEGGLTETEIDQLYQSDFKPIRLGPRILRTETAPLYALSALSYYFEETE